MNDAKRLQPLFLVKPGTVPRGDIRRAERRTGICIVECAEPEAARFCEAPALPASLDDQARAALSLFRMVLYGTQTDFKRGELTKWFVESLMEGKRPDDVKRPVPVAPVKR